ncbi:beta-galactosidase [Burkholderia stagnalis]
MDRRNFLAFSLVSPILAACGGGDDDSSASASARASANSLAATSTTGNPVFSSGGNHVLSWTNGGAWTMDGTPFQFFGGEIHPARVPYQYWDHRIKMLKAMGCNTISLYAMWNYHELPNGTFDFSSPGKNIGNFIDLCAANGMWVLLRPGPYVCAEWDFGGLPPRMLADPQFRDGSGNVQIRGNFPNYMAAVNAWNSALYNNVVKGRTLAAGGPIMLVAVENEYTSWSPDDSTYPNAIASQWSSLGYTEKLCAVDGFANGYKNNGITMPPNAAYGMTADGNSVSNYATAIANYGVAAFGAECYPGWICYWGDSSQTCNVGNFVSEVTSLTQANRSFVLYVGHGGTNFGFTGGCEGSGYPSCTPGITSYDYGAPVSESGQTNPNYVPIQSAYVTSTGYDVPFAPVPAAMPIIADGEVATVSNSQFTYCDLLSNVSPNIQNTLPLSIESLALTINKSQPSSGVYPSGVVVYQATLPSSGGTFNVTFDRAPDFAMVFVNGTAVPNLLLSTVSNAKVSPTTSFTINNAPPSATLQIICMPFGRANHVASQMLAEGRGLSKNVYLNGTALTGWKMALAPLTATQISSLPFTGVAPTGNRPFFASTTITIGTPKDMYIDMSNWGSGYVFVNGQNLGRYWAAVGPQTRLYCPGVWLNSGSNTIVVFEFTKGAAGALNFYGESGLPLNVISPLSASNISPPVTGATYFIQNVYSGLYLDVMPATGSSYTYPGQRPQSAAMTQGWTISSGSSGSLVIVNASTGACLDAAGHATSPGSSVVLYSQNGGANQNWKPIGISPGVFNLIGQESQLLLDVNGETKQQTAITSSSAVANIIINSRNNPNQTWPYPQQWRFIPAIFSGGIYTIKGVVSGLYLGTYQGGTSAGTRLGIAAATGGQEQQWQMTYNTAGYWVLGNVKSGMVMDVQGHAIANGTPVDIWGSNGGGNQQFVLQPRPDGVSMAIVGVQSGCVIDDNGSGTSPTTYGSTNVSAITIWADNGGANQSWIFTRVG